MGRRGLTEVAFNQVRGSCCDGCQEAESRKEEGGGMHCEVVERKSDRLAAEMNELNRKNEGLLATNRKPLMEGRFSDTL